MLDCSTDSPAGPEVPEDDDARDLRAAAAPLGAVRALVADLDRAAAALGPVPWQVLVAALQSRAADLAGSGTGAWRLAAGSGVPLEHWTAGAWATALRTALLADGFRGAAADQAVDVVGVHLLRTCPTAGAGAPGPGSPALEGYPALARLRPRLSAEPAEAAGSADGLVARVAALRG